MKYMITWNERPQGTPIEYENAQKRILEVFSPWKAPANFKIESFVIRVGDWGGYMLMECDIAFAVRHAGMIGAAENPRQQSRRSGCGCGTLPAANPKSLLRPRRNLRASSFTTHTKGTPARVAMPPCRSYSCCPAVA